MQYWSSSELFNEKYEKKTNAHIQTEVNIPTDFETETETETKFRDDN